MTATIKNKPSDPPKTFRCKGCGGIFEYFRKRGRKLARKPRYCEECRKLKKNAQILRFKQLYKKLSPEKFKKGEKEEHFHRDGLIADVGGVSRSEAAEAMGISAKQIEYLERQVLVKIRTCPELMELWGRLKDELANGASLEGQKLFGPTSAARAELILDYQQAVTKWWQTYDEIIEQGCTLEALELLAEIQRFRRKIEVMLCPT